MPLSDTQIETTATNIVNRVDEGDNLESLLTFYGSTPKYHDKTDLHRLRMAVNKRMAGRKKFRIDPSAIEQGDYVDFGNHGKFYVNDPYYGESYFWVTKIEKDESA